MPNRDGTGPLGLGEHNGRGVGCCVISNQYNAGLGLGFGCKRGFGRGNSCYAVPVNITEIPRELLQTKKTS